MGFKDCSGARDKARIEAEKSKQIKDFMQSMLKAADPEIKGRNVTVARILDEASQRVKMELANHPEIQAAVRYSLGNTYFGLGLYDAAEPQLREALATNLKLFGRRHRDVGMAERPGSATFNKRETGRSEPLMRDSLAILREVHGEKHVEVAKVLIAIAEFSEKL